MNGKVRISILDGFRAIAILSVVFYHYFSRWTSSTSTLSLYPYGDKYNFFNYGYLGVQFFFVISGFVIFFTLERTNSISTFWQKRMIRLLPSIIIASLLTFIFFTIFDKSNVFPDSHSFKNFLLSVSFIKPSIFNDIFNLDLAYINGSYWSLWPEIQFYIFSSILYFHDKKRFLANFMITSIVLICINYILQNIQGSNKLNIELSIYSLNFYNKWITNGFNLIIYLPFFCLGILFYKILSDRKENIQTSRFLKFCFFFIIVYIIYSGVIFPVRLIYLVIVCAFIIFIYYPKGLRFLEKSPFTDIGESSYFLYLIHENLGVFIIYTIGQSIWPKSFITPLILIIGFSYLSIVFSRKIDQPINNWLKYKLVKQQSTSSLPLHRESKSY